MKIVFTGPESSGKTTLAQWLSDKYAIMLVPEVSRDYLVDIGLGYTYDDVRKIGLLQYSKEKSCSDTENNLICDTDLLTTLIWQKEKYGRYDDDLYGIWRSTAVDIYYLCAPDIPWEYDDLRENPQDRWRLYEYYLQYLYSANKPFIEIKGSTADRKATITSHLSAEFDLVM